MSDYEEAERGSLDLRNMTGAELLARVCSMFEEAPNPDGAFLDVSFKDSMGFPRVMRMFMPSNGNDHSTH
jgi:hypothetical protein